MAHSNNKNCNNMYFAIYLVVMIVIVIMYALLYDSY